MLPLFLNILTGMITQGDNSTPTPTPRPDPARDDLEIGRPLGRYTGNGDAMYIVTKCKPGRVGYLT